MVAVLAITSMAMAKGDGDGQLLVVGAGHGLAPVAAPAAPRASAGVPTVAVSAEATPMKDGLHPPAANESDPLIPLITVRVVRDGPPPTVAKSAQVEPTPEPIAIPDWRIRALDDFLAGSPLSGTGAAFVSAADRWGLDWRLMPAVSVWESGKGRQTCGAYNPFGLGRCQNFGSWEEAIDAATATMARYGVDTATGLCWWVAGPSGACNYGYVGRVLSTMEGIG